eukprot:7388522-Prymnesium_polylepis.1
MYTPVCAYVCVLTGYEDAARVCVNGLRGRVCVVMSACAWQLARLLACCRQINVPQVFDARFCTGFRANILSQTWRADA